MDFARKNINNEKGEKMNYIKRLIKNIKSGRPKNAVHCNDYSSVICLRCDKCWANSSKPDDKPKTE